MTEKRLQCNYASSSSRTDIRPYACAAITLPAISCTLFATEEEYEEEGGRTQFQIMRETLEKMRKRRPQTQSVERARHS